MQKRQTWVDRPPRTMERSTDLLNVRKNRCFQRKKGKKFRPTPRRKIWLMRFPAPRTIRPQAQPIWVPHHKVLRLSLWPALSRLLRPTTRLGMSWSNNSGKGGRLYCCQKYVKNSLTDREGRLNFCKRSNFSNPSPCARNASNSPRPRPSALNLNNNNNNNNGDASRCQQKIKMRVKSGMEVGIIK